MPPSRTIVRHHHTDPGRSYRPSAPTPLAAFRSFLVRTLGAVVLTGVVAWSLPIPVGALAHVARISETSELYWGVDLAAQPLAWALPEYVATRITSPVVLAPAVVATVVTLAVEYRRRSTAEYVPLR